MTTVVTVITAWAAQVTLIAAAAWLAVRLGRNGSPRFRHALVFVALVSFLVPPVLSIPGAPTALGGVAALVRPVAADGTLATFAVSGQGVRIAGAIWFLGFAAVIGLVGLQSFYLSMLRRSAVSVEHGELAELVARVASHLGIRRVPRLFVSDRIPTPCVAGVIRPAVLLPRSVASNMSATAMAQLITHELAHLRQRDPWLNWIRALACAVWWPHPFVWMLARASRALREECCDDVVLTEWNAPPREYARTILTAASFGGRSATTMLASGVHDDGPGGLRSRIVRLGNPSVRRSRRLSWAQTIAVLAFAALALNGAAVHGSAAAGRSDEPEATRIQYVHLDGSPARTDDSLLERHRKRHASRHASGH